VQKLDFRTPDPLDHVCRTLDAMRKMGFDLVNLVVEQATGQTFRVSITFNSHGLLTVGTLIDRVACCVGVHDLTHEAEEPSLVPA
jgi:hypothetical protein